MSDMYQLPEYMPQSTKASPADIIFKLPNYHAYSPECNGVPVSNGDLVLTDPVELIEKKQLALIENLQNLAGKLNELLQKRGTAAKDAKPVKAAAVPAPKVEAAKEASPAEGVDGGKKDKDAKKEARKAAKVDAKNKVATGDAPAPQKGKQNSSAKQWVIKEERRSTETGQSLTACIPPEYASFKKEAVGTLTLTITAADVGWAKAMAAVAEKMEVLFTGTVSNKATKATTTVEVKQGAQFELSMSGKSLSSRVVAWKLLGAALGLFSHENTQAIQAAHQHQWLVQADLIVRGIVPVAEVTREASQFLSRFDTLGSQFNVAIADVVLRSLLSIGSSQPNNIELWAKRVDSL